ncbi:sulfite exporter TauE/SafE family protein [Agaribacter flavus]|uniref:Probable membrane transporter protein n=1 Tax=Agaribacter flavus TaxID=1902781 RepID=A0ABV7FUU3_9ALTE
MEIPELSWLAIAVMCGAVIIASVITSVTGMAGGILMFAAMSIYIPLKPLIATHGAVQIFNNATRTWYLRKHIHWQKCWPFIVGATLGTVVTTVFIAEYLGEFYPLLLLVGLTIYTLFKPKRLPDIKVADKHFVWVGFATGFIGITVGVIDPILAVFFMRDDLSKEAIIANKSMMQAYTHLTKIPAFIYLGFSFIDAFELILILSLAGVVGAKLGVWLLDKIDNQLFFKLMRFTLFLALIKMLYQLYSLL